MEKILKNLKRVSLFLVLIMAVGFITPTQNVFATEHTFTNPIRSSLDDQPWISYYGGNYYTISTFNPGTSFSAIYIRKSPTIGGLNSATNELVWQPIDSTRCCDIWAPELHFLDNPDDGQKHWYLIYTAGAGGGLFSTTQRTHVLESSGTDPMGPYSHKAQIYDANNNGWAIDGDYMPFNNKLYFLWATRAGDVIRLNIAEMDDPWTLSTSESGSGSGVVISSPNYWWEQQPGWVNEAPQAIEHVDVNGMSIQYIVYSASRCNTPDYKLGLLTLTGTDPLNAAHWTKSPNPIFQRNDSNGVYGPGHNAFFKSPDKKEDLVIYRANDTERYDCGGRTVRVQKFTWNPDGTPSFGDPLATETLIPVPAGDNGAAPGNVSNINQILEAENGWVNGLALLLDPFSDPPFVFDSSYPPSDIKYASSGSKLGMINDADDFVEFNINAPSTGTYDLEVRYAHGITAGSSHNVSVNSGVPERLDYPYTGWENWASVHMGVGLNSGNNTIRLAKGDSWAELDYIKLTATTTTPRLQNLNSGRCLDVDTNDPGVDGTGFGANVQQWDCWDGDNQKWEFVDVGAGYYELVNLDSGRCLDVDTNDPGVDGTGLGANVQQWDCWGGDNQKWFKEDIGGGSFTLKAKHSGKCLGVWAAGTSNGNNVIQWTCNGGDDQTWREY